MLRVSRKVQAIVTILFGVFLAGFVVMNGRLEGLEPWQKNYGVQQYVNHMIDTYGQVRTVLGILAVAALAALATLALPERRR
jgi:hypothetical protein